MTLLSVSLILFLIMDPVGSIATFQKMLQELAPARRRFVLLREMLIALAITLFVYFIGDALLGVLEVGEVPVRLSSGIILFLVAIKILFPSSQGLRESLQMKGEPFIVPMAIPMIAGPSLLATVMLFAHMDMLNAVLFPAIILAWFTACLVLLLAPYLHKYLGNSGLLACEKLMGMVLVLLAIQRFMEGIQLFFLKQHNLF